MRKRLLLMVMLVSLFDYVLLAQVSERNITNPQLKMVGARVMSLGGMNPVIEGDINGMLINPAVIGHIDAMPFSLSNQSVLGYFDYLLLNGSFPLDFKLPVMFEDKKYYQTFVLGLTYGSVMLNNIPETTLDGNVHREIDTFSSGFNLYQTALGTVFYDFFGLNSLSAGVSLKYLTQSVKTSSRSAFGMDVGVIGTLLLGDSFIDMASVGFSLHNLVTSSLIWSDTGDQSFWPLEFLWGGRVDMMQERLSLFVHNLSSELNASSYSLGVEYFLSEGLVLRGSSNMKHVNVGTGLVFPDVGGLGAENYSLRLDYNMSIPPAPFDEDVTHTLSFTVLGESRPFSPRILIPVEDMLVTDPFVDLSGVGAKSTSVRIYNNGELIRSVQTNRFGQFKVTDFPLKEGVNTIVLRSYSIESDLSQESDALVMTLDTLPPLLDLLIYPEEDQLVVEVRTSDDIVEGYVSIEGVDVSFKQESDQGLFKGKDEFYVVKYPLPDAVKQGAFVPKKMSVFDVSAVDRAGNEIVLQEVPYFIDMMFPVDRHVQFKERLRIIGNVSSLVDRVTIDERPVFIDQNNRYSFNKFLVPGKNPIRFHVTMMNEKTIDYLVRVLHLKTFDDLDKSVKERREIEFMATLGVLEGGRDQTFRPYDPVTKKYLARVMVNMTGVLLPDPKLEGFLDVPVDDPDSQYILAAIEQGYMFANPDGTFLPNRELTFNEVIFFLSNAGVIGEEEVEDGEVVLTRAKLAEFLSFQPKYELEIEDMIDWESGYQEE